MFKCTKPNSVQKFNILLSPSFTRGEHYDRNLNLVVGKTPYVYLDKNAPVALVKVWNNLNIAHRNWVKEVPIKNNKNKLNALPDTIPQCNNRGLNNYRLNGFKKSLIDIC